MSILKIVITIILACIVLIALIKLRLIYSIAWLAVSFLIAEHKEWALHSFLFNSWHAWVWLAIGIASVTVAIIQNVKDIKKRKAKKNSRDDVYAQSQNFDSEVERVDQLFEKIASQGKNNFRSTDAKENRELLQEDDLGTGEPLQPQSDVTIDHQENAESDAADDNGQEEFHYCDHLGKFKTKWDYSHKKKDFFDSKIERKIFPILKTFINNEYLIIPHAAPREILGWKWDDNWILTNKVNRMHFDFVIFEQLFTDKMSVMLFPVLFIEVNGSSHEETTETIERDEFKQKLLEQFGYKLAIIDATKTIPDEELEQVVVKNIKDAVPSRKDYIVHCPVCKKPMIVKKNKNHEYFYGHEFKNSEGKYCPGINISDIAPLYDGIPIEGK